jgi:hypothetical protein
MFEFWRRHRENNCLEIDHWGILRGVYRKCILHKGHTGPHYGKGREF